MANYGRGVNTARGADLAEYFAALSERLRLVRVCCGDWTRVCGPAVLRAALPCGVFLDPPYHGAGETRDRVYGTEETDCWGDVCQWCAANGTEHGLRICLAGYEGGWTPPAGWREVAWKAKGGYSNQGGANANRHRERLWFSPGCLDPQPGLFEAGVTDELVRWAQEGAATTEDVGF